MDLEGNTYCYMWRPGGFASRFPKIHDHALRLNEEVLRRVPKKGGIFVGSSTDMFCDQVLDEWIWKVLHRINTWVEDYEWDYRDDPYERVKYFLLTKKPERYVEFRNQLNENHIWLGTTWDGTEKTRNNVNIIGEFSLYGYNTYVSFEPLLDDPAKYNVTLDYSLIKWIIIGADSGKGKPKPLKKWADYLIAQAKRVNAKVFIKDNYGYPEEIKELPNPFIG
jgi:protein gp37